MGNRGQNGSCLLMKDSSDARIRRVLRIRTAVVLGITILLGFSGCSQQMPDREVRMTRGYVYYLDGAGGGGRISNWSRGLRQGFLDAGYDGAGEMFRWQTGLGMVVDQNSSVAYKQGKAVKCAQRIQRYRSQYPQAPVSLIGLSAGTAVAAYTLEALPSDLQVEDVVLLGASISADYDMTRALEKVRNRLYVFTSEHDAVLAYLVPISGTADRERGVPAAGLDGFQMPRHASAETRRQYAKISHVAWRPDFEAYGNSGRHTDTVRAPFVQAFIAPLIMHSNARRVQPELSPAVHRVANPDYIRWARFSSGSETTFEGYQRIDGVKYPMRVTARLISKHEDTLVVERTYVPMADGGSGLLRVQHFFVLAQIQPQDHPLTSPRAKSTRHPNVRLTVAGRLLDCQVQTLQAPGDYPEWGRDVTVRAATHDAVPGGVVRVHLKASKKDQPFEFEGHVVDYKAISSLQVP